ncbi:MAG: hypothetical protein OEY57_16645, partial [Nitrospirota bacterium]|nr:hypothetical protein [Nitrospirota bacterium]
NPLKMVHYSFLIYWETKECKVLVEDIRHRLAVGVETSKPQGRILHDLPRRRRGLKSRCGRMPFIPLKQFFEYRIIYFKNTLIARKKITGV